MTDTILWTIAVVTLLGLVLALVLYLVARRFRVEEDPRIDEVEKAMPGANCGGCGFAGCRAFAESAVKAPNLDSHFCPVGGNDTMARVAAILGYEVKAKAPMVAVVRCNGSCEARPKVNEYDGFASCYVKSLLYTGDTGCAFGCLGCGDCVAACQFGALSMDPVTGLPSRHRFLLARQEGAKSILLLRVGRLEKVNADYGYSRGNEVLRRVAQCLRDAVGGSGTVYRLDGAAFAVLSDRLGQAEIQELYENLRDALYRVIETDGVTHRLLASGGLLLRAEKPSLNEQEVCDCLARACAESEQNRQGELVVFCEAGAKKPAELAVTREIRRCMAKDFEHFFLLYQPVYDRDTGRPVGAEALLRWKHAQYGELTPARFLADVEWESRFRELGYWVLRGAMMDGRLFLNADPDFTVCVNLSPGQITDACFAETAAELAAQAGFPLDRLCLELRGDCRRLPTEQLRRFAAPLRALGVRIGIDDYGSGDAWFDALRSMDFDYVKFSSEFARSAAKDETGLSAVRYLAELARAHHAEVYVKAIESEAMADALRGLPVRGVQCRCFSDAVYFDDVLDLIEARKTTV